MLGPIEAREVDWKNGENQKAGHHIHIHGNCLRQNRYHLHPREFLAHSFALVHSASSHSSPQNRRRRGQ